MNSELNILIIDDNDITNYLTENVFEMANFSCHRTYMTSGQEAIEYLEKKSEDDFPNIILLDINMPGMDGWEFLEKYVAIVHPENQNTKVIMLSTSIFEKDRIIASEHEHVSGYIQKPFTIEAIEEYIPKLTL